MTRTVTFRGSHPPAGLGRRVVVRVEAVLGGPRRTRVILLFAAVLALNSADLGTVGAVAPQLKPAFDIRNTELGLLATVSAGVGAVAAVPMGVFADRVNRMRLLVASVTVWSVALGLGGFAPSYPWLLLSRLALGAAAAAAGPVLASLVGDLFPVGERARVYGWILSGEMVGAGFGLLVGSNISAALSWRYAFWMLGLIGLAVAVALHRMLDEPRRGGASRLPAQPTETGGARGGRDDRDRAVDPARSMVARHGVPSASDRVLHRNPADLPLWRAAWYLLSIPTFRSLIIASAVGYFFFAGLRTFGLVFVERHYGVGQASLTGYVLLVGVGGLVGAVLGGRVADGWLSRGRESARVLVPAVGYTAVAVLFAPALLTVHLFAALPLLVVAAAMLAAANPPLDAARLDIVTGRLWGRAESVRTLLRLSAEALAPLLFGVVADRLGGRGGGDRAAGLRDTFLIMLVPLLANGLIVLLASRTYPTDVATASASDRAVEALAPEVPR
ncbi:MAG TPA: MFS transporter [Micromonosporaceae bacterium]